jgi:hypothetical protein
VRFPDCSGAPETRRSGRRTATGERMAPLPALAAVALAGPVGVRATHSRALAKAVAILPALIVA